MDDTNRSVYKIDLENGTVERPPEGARNPNPMTIEEIRETQTYKILVKCIVRKLREEETKVQNPDVAL